MHGSQLEIHVHCEIPTCSSPTLRAPACSRVPRCHPRRFFLHPSPQFQQRLSFSRAQRTSCPYWASPWRRGCAATRRFSRHRGAWIVSCVGNKVVADWDRASVPRVSRVSARVFLARTASVSSCWAFSPRCGRRHRRRKLPTPRWSLRIPGAGPRDEGTKGSVIRPYL